MEGLDDLTVVLFLFFFAILALRIVIYLLEVVGLWNIFKKGNEEGWKSLIPIYNKYTLCKVVGVSPYWLIIVYGGILLSAVPLVNLVVGVASIYFKVLLSVSLAKSFEKSEAFAVGLFLLTPIFYLILGLSSAKYIGQDPMADIIFQKQSLQGTSPNIKYCPNCGTSLLEDSIYCSSCGAKIK